MATDDPIAELRRKFLRDLKEAGERSAPTLGQMRRWEYLRWWYRLPAEVQARLNVQPIGPDDYTWLHGALAALDDLD